MTASGVSPYARHLIDALHLAPHPEGGWYRRTWQSPVAAPAGPDPAAAAEKGPAASPATAANVADLSENSTSARPLASLIYFLLPAGDSSDWHVVDADELWLWHGPGAVTIELAGSGAGPDPAQLKATTLRMDQDGALTQLVVPAGVWQRTVPSGEDALVSCVVSPGFVYAGFKLARD
ncbi:cupin domain-containing protein [Parafannyhessea sp. LCP21S3_E6]|uniref:cupin domain-containing protein n=1 Tax=Parafannyhessea sp. LCP21S3_E6 TaxID=3438796 RepID=UPI003F9A2796